MAAIADVIIRTLPVVKVKTISDILGKKLPSGFEMG